MYITQRTKIVFDVCEVPHDRFHEAYAYAYAYGRVVPFREIRLAETGSLRVSASGATKFVWSDHHFSSSLTI
jgi:hypothetical protein